MGRRTIHLIAEIDVNCGDLSNTEHVGKRQYLEMAAKIMRQAVIVYLSRHVRGGQVSWRESVIRDLWSSSHCCSSRVQPAKCSATTYRIWLCRYRFRHRTRYISVLPGMSRICRSRSNRSRRVRARSWHIGHWLACSKYLHRPWCRTLLGRRAWCFLCTVYASSGGNWSPCVCPSSWSGFGRWRWHGGIIITCSLFKSAIWIIHAWSCQDLSRLFGFRWRLL